MVDTKQRAEIDEVDNKLQAQLNGHFNMSNITMFMFFNNRK
jgi:hypothetical protein